ncbi:Sodium/glutamate symporter [Caprobacter fermentans]|uniref:Sodium/glutamate symporter n=1 Tax=Caproicibacter fermentans TaxID=2576756 RepID=A0A6N8I3R5_9FIRM|nr:sodium/glutamate symporter [Caproicibacter fermentans]MVB12791.1 Sodium/glutamate symporter [Caproicibacter fermentans]OCN01560.1 sodium/glutamate symporter [Clostridium sp. W14A]
MTEINLDMFQAGAVAALVYCLGRFLIEKVPVLNKYCIPAPVVGGLIFSILNLCLHLSGIAEIGFDSTLQTVFMTIFFCTVGFTACFSLLKKGGIQVLMYLGLALGMVILQDLIGGGLAGVFGIDPKLGLCMGSIPLVGGHGTSAAFGPMLEKNFGVVGATTVAIAAATFGLVAGGVMGGPLARRRIQKHGLHSTALEENITDAEAEEKTTIHPQRFVNASLFIAVAIGAGTLVVALFKSWGITVPGYIGAMLVAVVIRNVWDAGKKEVPMPEIDSLGNLSLQLFLAMALMGLKLWQLASLAVPMIVILLVQTILMASYAYFAVFNLMGRDYEAAAMTTAFCGFGMGATPNAMANMGVLADRYGPCPRAYFIVPLVGSLFIDMFNSGILTIFINLFP